MLLRFITQDMIKALTGYFMLPMYWTKFQWGAWTYLKKEAPYTTLFQKAGEEESI